MVIWKHKSDHVTSLLKTLHWLIDVLRIKCLNPSNKACRLWPFLGFQNPRRVPPTLFTVNRALKRFSRVSRDHLESRTGPRAPEVPTWPLWQLYSWAGKDENLEATNWAKGGSKGRNKEEIRMKSEPHLKSTSVLGPPQ